MLINDFLTNSTKRLPDKTAIVHGGRRISYAKYHECSNQCANLLKELGVNRQDRVAIYLENSFEAAMSVFGIAKAGGVFILINPQVKASKLSYILNDCQVKYLITDSQGLTQCSSTSQPCSSLKGILHTGYTIFTNHKELLPDLTTIVPVQSFEKLLAQSSPNDPPRNSIDVDLASLMYTSGSTGGPKGVMLTHANMVCAANSITQYLENSSEDIILNYLPLSFDYGLYQVLMASKFGGTVVLEKSFVYPYQAVEAIQQEHITGLPLVPAMAALILGLKNLSDTEFPTVRYITNTGQAFPPAHIKQLQSIFKDAKIFSMYGLTECKRVSYLDPSELQNRPGSVGKAIPNTEVWLIDETGQQITEPFKTGELVIRGSHIMKGYWNKPTETAQVLRPGVYPDEKVLLSRDYFKMDDEGFLYFVSRKDDVIKSGGERISPKEIEDVLYNLEGIAEVAVIGIPDSILGNALKAFLVFKQGSLLTEQEIRSHCEQNLEKSRIPKQFEIRDSLPKSSNGKIHKRDLPQTA